MTKDHLTKLITEVLGERCPEHHEQCMTCAAWWMFDRLPVEPKVPLAESSASGSFTELVWQPKADLVIDREPSTDDRPCPNCGASLYRHKISTSRDHFLKLDCPVRTGGRFCSKHGEILGKECDRCAAENREGSHG